jgi:hypothetical protein
MLPHRHRRSNSLCIDHRCRRTRRLPDKWNVPILAKAIALINENILINIASSPRTWFLANEKPLISKRQPEWKAAQRGNGQILELNVFLIENSKLLTLQKRQSEEWFQHSEELISCLATVTLIELTTGGHHIYCELSYHLIAVTGRRHKIVLSHPDKSDPPLSMEITNRVKKILMSAKSSS